MPSFPPVVILAARSVGTNKSHSVLIAAWCLVVSANSNTHRSHASPRLFRETATSATPSSRLHFTSHGEVSSGMVRIILRESDRRSLRMR
jgi:hypothetical protein